MKKTGILIINTGSPDSCRVSDIKKYLREFLMDERVIDIPEWQRKILVYGIISPFRAKKSARLYENIWQENGSPLIDITRQQSLSLQKETKLETFFAMRYGNPSIKSALGLMQFKGLERIIIVPMFPHYAMSTWESVVEKTKIELQHYNFKNISVIDPFFDNKEYIKALYENSKSYLKKNYDAIILSYHSLPVRHILKADESRIYCMKEQNCCSKKNKAHKTCYRAQTFQTTKLFSLMAKLPKNKVIHSYQSAMNKKNWLGPDTEQEIIRLAQEGKTSIAVICPGFTADNLETLEEINIRARNVFLENGGKVFTYIPALNTSKYWIKALAKLVLDEAKKF